MATQHPALFWVPAVTRLPHIRLRHAGHVSRVNTRYLGHVTTWPRDRCDMTWYCLHVSHFTIEERVFEYDIFTLQHFICCAELNIQTWIIFRKIHSSTKLQIINKHALTIRRCMLYGRCSFIQHKLPKPKSYSYPVFAKPLRCGQDSAAPGPECGAAGSGRPDAGRGRQVDTGQSGGSRGAGRIQQRWDGEPAQLLLQPTRIRAQISLSPLKVY